MSTVTDNDLRELKDFINSKFGQINEKIDTRFEQINEKLNEMKVDIATLKEGQNGLSKRLDNVEFTNRGIFISVISGLILALATIIVKFLSPNLIG
jgi:chromosome segregation ATPase